MLRIWVDFTRTISAVNQDLDKRTPNLVSRSHRTDLRAAAPANLRAALLLQKLRLLPCVLRSTGIMDRLR